MIRIKRHRHVPRLNTTSTADISFMLLIFFLVTTSMDIDKGLLRQLPPTTQQENTEPMEVQKDKLLEIIISDNDSATINGRQLVMASLRKDIRHFVCHAGKNHLITINASPLSSYDTYFNIQNGIVAAYSDLRNALSKKLYGIRYAELSAEQRAHIKELCPQRVSEQYNETATEKGGQP